MNAAQTTERRSRAASDVARPEWEEETGWQERALCRGADANLFFAPQQVETKEERLQREGQAKDICAECPVRAQCLEFALTTREPHGIWGGLNETERRQLLTRERQAG